jgi:Transposase
MAVSRGPYDFVFFLIFNQLLLRDFGPDSQVIPVIQLFRKPIGSLHGVRVFGLEILLLPGWRSRRRVRVQNAAEDCRSFAAFPTVLGFPVRIGFEPTSNYHRALAYFLHSQGFQLHLISSLALARTREAMHNSWDKDDPKDAQVNRHLLKRGLTQHYHDPIVHNLNDLQELSKTHHQVSLEKTRTQHRLLTHYLPLP